HTLLPSHLLELHLPLEEFEEAAVVGEEVHAAAHGAAAGAAHIIVAAIGAGAAAAFGPSHGSRLMRRYSPGP
ncbi:hypothetical protein, partial [Providencia stuartii]|uniref:hypothetical protein n=1 Tax=Providencia stuartii TaxID=588 RepID=UPI0013D26366